MLAPVLAQHLDGMPDRPAGMGLQDLRASGRYLLRSGGLSPVIDDRPHRNVQTLRAASADASASWPSVPGPGQRVPVDSVLLSNALHARQAGSRHALTAEDGRPQISRNARYREMPGGTSAAAFLLDAAGRIGVPSP